MGDDVYCIKVRGGIVAQNEHTRCPKCSHLWGLLYSAHTRLNYFCFLNVCIALILVLICMHMQMVIELFFVMVNSSNI